MKTSKAALQNHEQDECGVWLDTAQLKEKVKKKRLARPISKLLNPFAKGDGYNLAVALNFTQTKVEMPKTKQSSISMFFTPHRKALHKMCSSESPSLDPVQPFSASTSAAASTVKRRGRDLRINDSGVDCGRDESEAAPSQNQGHHLHLINSESEDKDSEESRPPQSKRRHTEPSVMPDDSQPPFLTWSQDPLFTCSQLYEGEFDPTELNYRKKSLKSSERSSEDGQSEEGFRSLTDVEGRTSTQIDKNLPQIDDEKENSRSLSLNTPVKNYSVCFLRHVPDHKWAEPKSTLSQKHAEGCNKAGKEVSSSPLQRSRKMEEDSLVALFTQDSEGFMVIAHRGLSSRSPLKDQSNVRSYKPEEDELLFTQDSQGNMVIKH